MSSDYTGIWKLIYDWQTLITGVLAVIGALIAARLVWRQLRSMEIQSALMVRDTLVTRVATIETRRDTTHQKMRTITAEFMGRLHPYDDGEGPPDINPIWADEAEQITDGVVSFLAAHQETSLDGELIDAKRKVAIQQAKALSDCLNKISAPTRADLAGPELGLTEEDIAAIQEDGAHAERDLESHISAVAKGADDLDAVFETRLKQLRSRLRRIDALSISDKDWD